MDLTLEIERSRPLRQVDVPALVPNRTSSLPASTLNLVEIMRLDGSYEREVLNLPEDVTEQIFYDQVIDSALRTGLTMQRSDLAALFGFSSSPVSYACLSTADAPESLQTLLESFTEQAPASKTRSITLGQSHQLLPPYTLQAADHKRADSYVSSINGDTLTIPPPLTPDDGSITDASTLADQQSNQAHNQDLQSQQHDVRIRSLSRAMEVTAPSRMWAAQHSMRERFAQHEKRQALALGADHSRRREELLKKQAKELADMKEHHTAILGLTEDQQLETELLIEERQRMDIKASAIRLKHIEAACSDPAPLYPSSSSLDLPPQARVITSQDHLHLANSRRDHACLPRRQADEIRMLRNRQSMQLTALEKSQAAQVTELEGSHAAESDKLSKSFEEELASFNALFDARMRRLLLGWFLEKEQWREGAAVDGAVDTVEDDLPALVWAAGEVWPAV